jgi:hypothetical protein
MIALAALALLAAPANPAPVAPAQPAEHDGDSMLGASDRAAVAELRAAEAHLIADLQGDDRLAWVQDYTEDAVFQEGTDDPRYGDSLLNALNSSAPTAPPPAAAPPAYPPQPPRHSRSPPAAALPS